MRMLVGHAAATAFRTRVRRTRHAPRSLDALLRAARCPNGPDEPAAPGSGPRTEHARALSLDVAAVLATLPGPLRRVAEALKTRPVAAAARHLGLSRTALYRRLGSLRAAFAGAGLEIFCAPRADTRRTPGVVLQGKATARTSDVE
ncbi:helix-turn-helix domain-containing protein [Gemmata massiliana]|nr:helix-turn-helix domain-containing protein [Gemmata massiliana]